MDKVSALCLISILFIHYLWKNAQMFFIITWHSQLILKTTFLSLVWFCKNLSFSVSHSYCCIFPKSSYWFCPFLTMVQTLLCFFKKALESFSSLGSSRATKCRSCSPYSTLCHNCCQRGPWEVPHCALPSSPWGGPTAFLSPLRHTTIQSGNWTIWFALVKKESPFPKLDLEKEDKKQHWKEKLNWLSQVPTTELQNLSFPSRDPGLNLVQKSRSNYWWFLGIIFVGISLKHMCLSMYVCVNACAFIFVCDRTHTHTHNLSGSSPPNVAATQL